MMFRRWRRAIALMLALLACMVRYWLAHLCGAMNLKGRAGWLHESCRRVLAALNISSAVEGQPPGRGLIVANHLSYVDIAILGAVAPCFFVAKAEVSRWPFFGKAARAGGALFLHRSSFASANCVAAQMHDRLQQPIPVLLFPEGTSSDGSRLLRFHSRLIQPAIQLGAPITTAALRYEIENGPDRRLSERELCWYGDAGFLAHLWKLLAIRHVQAVVCFGEPQIYADCRTAAEKTRAEIAAKRGQAILQVPEKARRPQAASPSSRSTSTAARISPLTTE
jgi:lyso-ornithine lipid O-acyltransferase